MKTLRRTFFALLLFIPVVLVAGKDKQQQKPQKKNFLAYVGTYTGKTGSKGVYAYRFDSATGKLTSVGLAAESVNPAFLAVHPSGKYLYAVNEVSDFAGTKDGSVSAFAVDGNSGKLVLLNQVASGGSGPCYLSLDRTGKFIFVANYGGGSVAVFPILEDGSLGQRTGFVQHQGSSMNKDRQAGPHAHWIAPSAGNRFVYVSDLGLDKVLIYKFDAQKGTLTLGKAAAPGVAHGSAGESDPFSATLSPGTGPRHVAFSLDGNFMYVLGELQANVTVFANDSKRETFHAMQTISTLPADFSGPKSAAEIFMHPSGKYLYASNRGHDSIAAFAVDPSKGTLTMIGAFPTQGKKPRSFAIDPSGSYLLAANQDSNNIVVFRIDRATGALTLTGQVVEIPAPVCITFLAKP